MTNDDVLYVYRLRVLTTAAELSSVAAACRIHGIHRSTSYRWKGMVDRFGLEIRRPRERRAPQMPNSVPVLIEHRIVAWSLGHPGTSAYRRRTRSEKYGGSRVSASGLYRVLRRHGLHTSSRRRPARRLRSTS